MRAAILPVLSQALSLTALGLVIGLGLRGEAAEVARPPQRFAFTARASELDPKASPHPAIDFVFEKDGKPEDVQHAAVDTRVPSRGRLVVWLMPHNELLFERLTSYGLHAVQPHYANKWFGIVKPTDRMARGLVRLEAATGRDVSDQVAIPRADGMMERTRIFLGWLASENPEGRWNQFLTDGGTAVRWERVIIAGASHGATTAARFAKEIRCDRAVMLCGPRDQDQDWQSLPSATPPERFFGFSHDLDDGWIGHHYCRSWEMLGMEQFGPIVSVDERLPPYGNTRRLISAADVGGDRKKAHAAVQPRRDGPKASDGSLLYEPVWEYLFTHPVEKVGERVPPDPACRVEK
jgi:hypothetical protein